MLFSENLISSTCVLGRSEDRRGNFYLGVDVAGYGKDENAFCVLKRVNKDSIEQREQIIRKRILTIETTREILLLESIFGFKRIGVDDGGLGFGVFSELMDNDKTKRKTEALNNASRILNNEEKKKKVESVEEKPADQKLVSTAESETSDSSESSEPQIIEIPVVMGREFRQMSSKRYKIRIRTWKSG